VAAHPGAARRRWHAAADPAPAAQAGGRAGREQPVAGGQPRRQPARRHSGMNARLVPRAQTDAAPSDLDLLRRTLAARVYEVARETPLEPAEQLSARLGNRVLLKREDLQPVFSFKLRGAYNKMAALDAAERARGVIAASAGNHAQGVALAAAKLGVRAVIVMPVTAPQVKVDAVRRFGGDFVEVVLAGDSYSDAQAAAARIEAERGLVFVHPFDDLAVIAGQATVGMELLRQSSTPLDAVFVPVGGGGLLAGVASCIKTLSPHTKVIGVQADDSDAMARSLETGVRVSLPEVGLFADGTAVKQVGALTFELCRRHVDAMLRVDGDALCAAIRDVYQETRSVPEPSGALALAGLKQYAATHQLQGATLAAIVSGANMNFERLRFVAERAEAGDERAALAAAFRAQGFAVLDLADDELAKLHLRHMVGGRSPLAQDERLYRFDFPE